MRSYRLLLLDKRVGSRSIDCVEGREAIAAANLEMNANTLRFRMEVDRFVSVQTRSLITKARNNFTAPHPTHAPLLPLPSHRHGSPRRLHDRGPSWSSPFDRAGPLEQA